MSDKTGDIRYLQFEPTEEPQWRSDKTLTTPTISKMITDILGYHTKWKQVKKTKSRELRQSVNKDFIIKYVFNIQQEEDIGVQDKGETEEIIEQYENCQSSKTYGKENHSDNDPRIQENKTASYEAGKLDVYCTTDDSHKRKDEEEDEDLFPQKRHKIDVYKTGATGQANEEPDSPEDDMPAYPSLGDTEDDIAELHESFSEGHKLEKNKKETLNLYKGYKHLAEQVGRLKKSEKSDYLGLLDIETCIKDTHAQLMKGIMAERQTRPGQFSTNMRSASFKDKTFIYPKFENEEFAFDAIQHLVDNYNEMIDGIKKIPDVHKCQKLSLSFRCASKFLFGFLTLHPFGDGNGRLARLLSSYCLCVFCPFLTPIYNVFSPSTNGDYVDALISARSGAELNDLVIKNKNDACKTVNLLLEQKPSDLCALVIESNWFMWRQFLTRMGENVTLSEWEREQMV